MGQLKSVTKQPRKGRSEKPSERSDFGIDGDIAERRSAPLTVGWAEDRVVPYFAVVLCLALMIVANNYHVQWRMEQINSKLATLTCPTAHQFDAIVANINANNDHVQWKMEQLANRTCPQSLPLTHQFAAIVEDIVDKALAAQRDHYKRLRERRSGSVSA